MVARAAQQLQFEKYEGLGNDFILVSSHRLSRMSAAMPSQRGVPLTHVHMYAGRQQAPGGAGHQLGAGQAAV